MKPWAIHRSATLCEETFRLCLLTEKILPGSLTDVTRPRFICCWTALLNLRKSAYIGASGGEVELGAVLLHVCHVASGPGNVVAITRLECDLLVLSEHLVHSSMCSAEGSKKRLSRCPEKPTVLTPSTANVSKRRREVPRRLQHDARLLVTKWLILGQHGLEVTRNEKKQKMRARAFRSLI